MSHILVFPAIPQTSQSSIPYLTTLLLRLDPVLSLVVVSEGVFLDIGVQGDNPGVPLE